MRHSLKAFTIAALVSMLVVTSGCDRKSDDIPTGPSVAVNSLISDGWANFRNGAYDAAMSNFSNAADRDATSLEAYLGMGWTSLQLNQLEQASGKFNSVISLASLPDLHLSTGMIDTLTMEAMTGQAQVQLANGDYQRAYSLSRTVLSAMPNFQFRHDTSVNGRSLTLLEAEAAFNLTEYSRALAAITRINPSLFNDATLLQRETRMLAPILLGSQTIANGSFRLDIADPALVYAIEVKDTLHLQNGVPMTITVDSISEGGASMFARTLPTPVPSNGAIYRVTYLRTSTYATFVGRLRSLINSLR